MNYDAKQNPGFIEAIQVIMMHPFPVVKNAIAKMERSTLIHKSVETQMNSAPVNKYIILFSFKFTTNN